MDISISKNQLGKEGNGAQTDLWTGCYDGGWQGLITPESFAHP